MSDLKIRDVRTIITHPPGARTLTVIKVETDEPERYGLGCASCCTRPMAVAAAVDDNLKPFLSGKPGLGVDINEELAAKCPMTDTRSAARNRPSSRRHRDPALSRG